MAKLQTLQGKWVDRIPFKAQSKQEELDFRAQVEASHVNDDINLVPYEEWYAERIESGKYKKCSDCGVNDGDVHQPGCDQERCPVCGGQLISCEHFSNDVNLAFH